MRRSALAIGVLLALTVGGCDGSGGGSGGDGPGTADPPDCSASECADEVAAYADAVAGLDGVERVRDVRYRGDQVTDEPSVTGEVQVAAGTDCAALEDDAGRLLWVSQVSPVASVTLRCFLPGAAGADYDYVSSSFQLEDRDELADRWGRRGG